MPIERFGDVSIFRPTAATAHFVRLGGREHLFSRFSTGEYRGAKNANSVLQHQYQYFEQILNSVIPLISSRDAADFLLFQYDEATRILHGAGIDNPIERERWQRLEPIFKRAIKYLVELICLNANIPSKEVSYREARTALEVAVACAESMVVLSHESDRAHGIFPQYCLIRILENHSSGLEVSVEGEGANYTNDFAKRIDRDRDSRHKFVPSPQFDNHTAAHQGHLDDVFCTTFDLSYGDFIGAIKCVIENCQPVPGPHSPPTLFVLRSAVIDGLVKSKPFRQAIDLAISGFTVSPERLKAEKRVLWNPKQEGRAYRRGFFLFPHEMGPHLAFSREMAKETLVQLVSSVCFRYLPAEWRTSTTEDGLDSLSRAASRWFEDVVHGAMRTIGIAGQRLHREFGRLDRRKIRIPDSVGEIDFLGYLPEQKMLILVEAKMTRTGIEPRYWRDDLDQFVTGSGSYAERFRRKVAWVSQNREVISDALNFGPVAEVGEVMLTLYPCIARHFIADFPCVSVTEFMLDYEEAKKWPYAIAPNS